MMDDLGSDDEDSLEEFDKKTGRVLYFQFKVNTSYGNHQKMFPSLKVGIEYFNSSREYKGGLKSRSIIKNHREALIWSI